MLDPDISCLFGTSRICVVDWGARGGGDVCAFSACVDLRLDSLSLREVSAILRMLSHDLRLASGCALDSPYLIMVQMLRV